MIKIKNISKTFFVFDLDDTIYMEYDYKKSGIKYILKVLKNLGFSYKFNLMYLMSLDNPFQHIIEKLSLPRYNVNNLIWQYRLHKPDIKLNEKTKKLIKYLYYKSAGIAILTDGRSFSQRQKLISLGLIKYPFYISEEYNDKKPQLKRLKLIMKTFNAENYVYVGDNINKDFFGPNKLKWLTIGLKKTILNIHKAKYNLSKNFYPKKNIDKITDLKKLILK